MAEILFVSLIHVLQNPDQYADKPVRVVGVASVKFEVTGLYVSLDDMRNAVTKNALWIEVPSNEETLGELSGKYVIVEGVFDQKGKGHLGMWSAQDQGRHALRAVERPGREAAVRAAPAK